MNPTVTESVADMQQWAAEAKMTLAAAAVDLKRERTIRGQWPFPAELRAKAVFEQYGVVIQGLRDLEKGLQDLERLLCRSY